MQNSISTRAIVLGVMLLASACPNTSSTTSTSSSGGPSCTAGAKDCACKTGNTCDGLLTCQANVCREVSRDTPGAACDAASPCGSYMGTQMTCEAGHCQLPGCPAGTVGCPCPDGMCSDTGTECNATSHVCVVTGCTPGSGGCTCGANNTCDTGLSCVAGACRAVGAISISVGSADVRACDILLQETTRAVTGVTFPASAIGEHLRRAPKVAISFTRKADMNPAGAVATVQLAGNGVADASSLTVVETHCFDRQGNPVATPNVHLE